MHGRLRTILICPDSGMSGELAQALAEFEQVALKATVSGYPSPIELARLLRAHMPDFILLSFERPDLALAVIQSLSHEVEGLPVIGISRNCESQVLRDGMRAGVRDFLTTPFCRDVLAKALETWIAIAEEQKPSYGGTDHVYSFLPSKPGAGASTLALNICAALGSTDDRRALLADLDLSCGMVRFLLGLGGEYSIVDAASHSRELDATLWPQLVAQRGSLDVLDSGPIVPEARLNPDDLHYVTAFARHEYQAICFDLSGNMERHSMEAMAESKRVFMVCTPDDASLQLASEKIAYLKTRALHERLGVLLNRINQRSACPPERVEDRLGVPVVGRFINDYSAVHAAVQAGTAVPKNTRLGVQFQEFASSLLGKPLAEDARKRGFLNFFSAHKAPVTVRG